MTTVAFVLTGGGSLGAVQVGMMQALHEHGIEPDLLVGTSAGAVNAAYLAGPGTTAQRLRLLAQLWSQTRRRDVFALEPLRWLAAAARSSPSLFPAQPLRDLLADHLGYGALEDARLQVHVTVADLGTGRGHVLTEGPAVPAVLASAAVPGLLPPVALGGRTLVDGAFGGHGALAHAAARGVDEIYLLPAGYACAGQPPTTALGVALGALSLLMHVRLLTEVRDHAGAARLRVVPPLCPLAVSPADFRHAGTLIERGRASTARWLLDGHPPEDATAALALHEHPRRAGRAGTTGQDVPA